MEALEVLGRTPGRPRRWRAPRRDGETIVAGGSSEAKAKAASKEMEGERERGRRQARADDRGGEGGRRRQLAEADLADLSSTMRVEPRRSVARREALVAEMYGPPARARTPGRQARPRAPQVGEAPARAASVISCSSRPSPRQVVEAIAVDWVAPPKADAAYFHLQWREQHRQVAEFEGVEAITVPCCTRAGCTPTCRTSCVRAASPARGRSPSRAAVLPRRRFGQDADAAGGMAGGRLRRAPPVGGSEQRLGAAQVRSAVAQVRRAQVAAGRHRDVEARAHDRRPLADHYLFRVPHSSAPDQQTKWTEWGHRRRRCSRSTTTRWPTLATAATRAGARGTRPQRCVAVAPAAW